MTEKSKRDDLFNLADNVVDAILNMSVGEMQEDLEGEGIALEDAKKAFDSILDSAHQKVRRKALAQSRAEMEADSKIERKTPPIDIEQAKAVVDRMIKGNSQLTLAARNARLDKMSDPDILHLAEVLLELDADSHKEEACG